MKKSNSMNQHVKYIGIAILGSGILPLVAKKAQLIMEETTELAADITQLTDEQYPDNNDIESRSELWNAYEHP